MSAELSQSRRTSPLSAADIDEAAQRISGVVLRSALQFSERLSEATGANVYLKREDLQAVRSYKLRGAYNLMMQLIRRGARRRRRVLVGGQSRPGVRHGLPVDGHSRSDLRAEQHAEAEARSHSVPRRRLHRVDRRSATPTTRPPRPRWTTSRAPVPRSFRRTTTRARWPVRAPSPPSSSTNSTANRIWSSFRSAVAAASQASRRIWPSAPQHVGAGRRAGGCGGDDRRVGRGGAGHARPRRPVRGRRGGAARARCTYAALAAAGDMVSITTADEGAVCTAMLDLYQNEGIIAEPAGALSVAALLETRLEPGSTVVCVISGGNNDVSRYGEVLERSLVHLGLKHYFLVDFPQEPGALRRFLDTVLGPNDDITLFEYVKRNNRETGEALVGVELGSAADFDGLLARMRASDIHVETLEPGSPAYRYLL